MCGLIMTISHDLPSLGRNLNDFMAQALRVGTLRGRDSTGLFTVNHNFPDKVRFFKRNVDGSDFMRMSATQELLSSFSNSVAVGHNRAATKGSVNAANAHPFNHDHIIGVHNGTLLTNQGLTWKDTFEVDSEAVFYTLSIKDPSEVIPQLDGAFALIWYNMKERMVHVVRNKERTLYYGLLNKKDKTTLLCASEVGMLTWLADRNGMHLEEVEQFEVGTEYVINPTKPKEIKKIKHKLYERPVIKNKYDFYRPSDNSQITYLPAAKKSSKLEKIGIHYQQRYSFWPDTFFPYGTNNRPGPIFGVMTGCLSDEPYYKVKVHGITHDQFDGWKTKAEVSSIALSLDNESKDDEPVIVMSAVDLKQVIISSTTGSIKYTDNRGKEVNREVWDKLVNGGCINCSDNLYHPDDVFWTSVGDPLCGDCNIHLKTVGTK